MATKLKVADILFLVGAFLLVTSLSHSRALISIAEGVIVLSGLFRIRDLKKPDFKNRFWLILSYIFLLGLLSYFTNEDLIEWERKVILRLPLLILPLGLLAIERLPIKWFVYVLLFFSTTVVVLAVLSTINYFMHYEEMNALVTQSKPMEIVSKVSHIYFSIFSCFSIISLGYLYFNFNKLGLTSWLKIVVLTLGIVNLICLHILSARTGLLGFYFSLFALGVLLVVKYKKLKLALIGAGIATVLIVVTYLGVTSFKNRIDNTLVDLKITYNNENPNYRSFAMRFEAWKTASHIISDNPVYGVGIGDVEHAMQDQYIADNTLLIEENRIPPHNQFLSDGVAFGLLGILLLVVLFVLPFTGNKFITHPMFIGFWGVLLMGFLFESVLERQRGVAFVAFFLFFIQGFIKAEQKQIK